MLILIIRKLQLKLCLSQQTQTSIVYAIPIILTLDKSIPGYNSKFTVNNWVFDTTFLN